MKSKKITKKTLKKLNSLARELELSTGLMVRWASWRDGERYFCFELVPWERQNRYLFFSGEKSVSAALSEFRRNIAYLLLDKTITDYYKPARQEEDQ